MNASKTFTAIAAAAALVGTIGYASAQQGGDSMPPNASSPTNNAAQPSAAPVTGTTGTSDMSTTPSAVPADTASTTLDSERAPQADRN